MPTPRQITSETVRADFNDPIAVVHYARAAHFLGLWQSEQQLIERFFSDRSMALLEAGCGAGRVTVGLWEMGFHQLTAFDFAEDLLVQARDLARERGIPSTADSAAIRFVHADATQLSTPFPSETAMPPTLSDPARCNPIGYIAAGSYDGALFMFNGLMQIPGRENRRQALREIRRACRPGAPFIFTTHDRDHSPTERALWRLEASRWERGEQDPRLVEFGDRYFEDETGRTFMHLPDRTEIIEDLAATGWAHEFDALRREVAAESEAVRDFADECRFWVARKKME